MTLVTVPTLIYGADDKADKAEEDQLRHPSFPEEEGPRCSSVGRAYVISLNANSSALSSLGLRCS